MNKKKVSVSLPPEVLKAYEEKAKEDYRSISSICCQALVSYYNDNLKNQENKNASRND